MVTWIPPPFYPTKSWSIAFLISRSIWFIGKRWNEMEWPFFKLPYGMIIFLQWWLTISVAMHISLCFSVNQICEWLFWRNDYSIKLHSSGPNTILAAVIVTAYEDLKCVGKLDKVMLIGLLSKTLQPSITASESMLDTSSLHMKALFISPPTSSSLQFLFLKVLLALFMFPD